MGAGDVVEIVGAIEKLTTKKGGLSLVVQTNDDDSAEMIIENIDRIADITITFRDTMASDDDEGDELFVGGE